MNQDLWELFEPGFVGVSESGFMGFVGLGGNGGILCETLCLRVFAAKIVSEPGFMGL